MGELLKRFDDGAEQRLSHDQEQTDSRGDEQEKLEEGQCMLVATGLSSRSSSKEIAATAITSSSKGCGASVVASSFRRASISRTVWCFRGGACETNTASKSSQLQCGIGTFIVGAFIVGRPRSCAST
jgi:hypothetical protein